MLIVKLACSQSRPVDQSGGVVDSIVLAGVQYRYGDSTSQCHNYPSATKQIETGQVAAALQHIKKPSQSLPRLEDDVRQNLITVTKWSVLREPSQVLHGQ